MGTAPRLGRECRGWEARTETTFEMKVGIRITRTQRGEYLVACSFLPGCIAHGRSAQEAKRRFASAAQGYVAAMSNFVPEQVDVYQVAS